MNKFIEWILKARHRIILLGLLIPGIPLLILAGFIYLRVSGDMEELLMSKIANIVTNVEERIESGSALNLTIVRLFVTRPHLLEMVEQGDMDQMNWHLEYLIRHFDHIDRGTIVNTEGIQIANHPFTPETIGMDFSERDYFLGVTKDWSPYVSDFFLRTGEPRRYAFTFSAPLIKEGTPLGILNLQPKTDYFHRLLRGIVIPDGRITIVDSKGYLIYDSLRGEIIESKDLSALPVVQKLMQGQAGLIETIDAETKEPILTSYSPIGGHGWGMIVDVPKRVVMAPLAEISIWMAAVTLFIFLAGGYIGYRWSLALETEREMVACLHQRTTELIVKNHQLTQMREIELLNQQLTEASAEKSNFLANVSHELRTPMNSIIGFSQVLDDGLAGGLTEKQKEYVGHIQSSGKHLLALLNDILDLSKVEMGRMTLEATNLSVRYEIEKVVAQFTEKCLEQNIELKIDIEPQADLEMEADEKRFKQIMLNLLSNAVKFTHPGGTITVTARLITTEADRLMGKEGSALTHKKFIEIAVSDTGIGIKSEDQDKLFKPFARLESAYSKNYEGTGLGLALTKRLVEMHHGRIWLKSKFGQGSTFTFILPLKQAG